MLMLFSKPNITACDKKMPPAHTSFITTAEESVLNLWLKRSVSAKVKVADGVVLEGASHLVGVDLNHYPL